MNLYDVIIIGGGPAGLNAAVVLGRCRRKILVFDTGRQRNIRSHGMHNYLTRDGFLPGDFIRIAHDEIKKYEVEFYPVSIVNAKKNEEGYFEAKDNTGQIHYSKKMLVATGLVDNVPEIDGIDEFYGKSVFHCPYCDGWEVRDKRIGVLAKNKNGIALALALKTWSSHLTLYTNGKKYIKADEKEMLDKHNIKLNTNRIENLAGTNGLLEKIIFKNAADQPCDAIFFTNGYNQHCELVEELGCTMSKIKKVAVTNRQQGTNIKGLYVAGDAARDMHFVVVAAAEGAKAAVNINKELQKEEIEAVENAFELENTAPGTA